jgi:hypothetical protein
MCSRNEDEVLITTSQKRQYSTATNTRKLLENINSKNNNNNNNNNSFSYSLYNPMVGYE